MKQYQLFPIKNDLYNVYAWFIVKTIAFLDIWIF